MTTLVVFASGRGSNFKVIHRKTMDGFIPAKIVGLISDRENAPALEFARQNDIPFAVHHPRDFSSEQEFGDTLLETLERFGPDFIVLAGYLKKIPDNVIRRYPLRILNIHPALLPSFGGKGMYGHYVHRAVFEAGVKVSGVTVHFVTTEYDAGPIVMQQCVDIADCHSPDEIAQKVLRYEHAVYPRAIKSVLENEFEVVGKRVIFKQRVPHDSH